MNHMSGVKAIDQVKTLGGTVISFSSVWGGLRSPKAADIRIGYENQLESSRCADCRSNAARYRTNGQVINVKGQELQSASEAVHFLLSLALEQIPYGDSLVYCDLYGIPHAETLFRRTLRTLDVVAFG
uniref:Alphaaminoadipic semialdehyde synthase putative n=1 Tax=Albugo laibachii Nc14 TaxID=890382 RepID=F0WRP3_9STRA|nr:alphaaminoadipic semialdehyde synthase putative [Albugo laibachii Nc14]|eukprot:CCA24007.1 alphaaminoadipic semialdehyde synthase putative [Albugo laibachii Nc14]